MNAKIKIAQRRSHNHPSTLPLRCRLTPSLRLQRAIKTESNEPLSHTSGPYLGEANRQRQSFMVFIELIKFARD